MKAFFKVASVEWTCVLHDFLVYSLQVPQMKLPFRVAVMSCLTFCVTDCNWPITIKGNPMHMTLYQTIPPTYGQWQSGWVTAAAWHGIRGPIQSPWLGDKVDYGIGLSYRPVRLHRLVRAGTTTPICHSQHYPPLRDYEFGPRILPLAFQC
jgi:hypothetical protein